MEPELLGRLVDQYAAVLVLYARQRCETPEDVVQEAFLKLSVQKQQPKDVAAWLYRVVHNAAVSAARSMRRRRRHETVAAELNPPWFKPSPSSLLGVDEATAALQQLPVDQRETIVLHLWGGLTFEQIAEVSGISSSTAHRWYVAGLTALRERLKI